jgi:D-amino-acid dehydrogenase
VKRVAIVGGGVIGLAAALCCAERGMRVALVERNGPQRDGCSFGNTGMVVPSHFVPLAAPGMVGLAFKWLWDPGSPFYVRPRPSWELLDWGLKFWRAASRAHVRRAAPLLCALSLASRASYERLAARDIGFGRRGVLMLCRTQRALDEEARIAEEGRALGLQARVLDASQTAALEPGLRMRIAGSVHFPDDCNLEPRRLVETLQAKLSAAGAELLWDREVTGWRVEGGGVRAARLGDGEELRADEFVLAAGSWSAGLARGLGLRLPLEAGKGYSLTLARPRAAPRHCALLVEARVAVSPIDGALRFGGTMELDGLDERINPVRVRAIVEAVSRYYPDFGPADFEGVRPWAGLRPCTPDGLPYVGRSARFSNLIVAAGHAMLGVSLAPATGEIVAALAGGGQPGFDIALLSPDRFH